MEKASITPFCHTNNFHKWASTFYLFNQIRHIIDFIVCAPISLSQKYHCF